MKANKTALIFLILETQNDYVRFHGEQQSHEEANEQLISPPCLQHRLCCS